MKSAADFLKQILEEAIEENAHIDEWLGGKWPEDIKAFLENWCCNDVEDERDGRTDEEMAIDLDFELQEMRLKNNKIIFLAKHWLKSEHVPAPFENSITGYLYLEQKVEELTKG